MFRSSFSLSLAMLCLIVSSCFGQAEPSQAKSASEKLMEQLPQLQQAVEANPEDVAARANLAMALYQLGNIPEAWKQLIVARKQQPDHQGVAKGLTVVFAAFEGKGVFSVGVPKETVENLLGEPTQKVELGKDRTRWVYVFWGVEFRDGRVHEVIDLRGATQSLFTPTETVSIDLDGSGWTCGYRKKKKGNVSAFYFVPGESVANWTQEFSIERILDGAKLGTVDAIAAMMEKQVLASDPNSQQKVLKSDEGSIIVALILPGKEGAKPKHKLVQFLKGPVDLHRISYTVVGDEPTREVQMKWLEIFEKATLVEAKRK